MKNGILKVGIVVFALAVLLSACTDDDNQQPVDAAIDNPDHIVLRADSEAFASWEEFYSKDDISFSIDSFRKTDTVNGELFSRKFIPDDSFYACFGKLLVYNSDSSMFIDAYSTSWIVEAGKDGLLHAREGEVDQEVTVVNTKTNMRTRLLFCGPACQVQKAFWYNDQVVGIMGLMAEYADEYYTPTIWFVNINTGTTIPYQYHSSVSIIYGQDYMKRHMESKGVKLDY